KQNKFLGVVSLRRILIAEKKQKLGEIRKQSEARPVVHVDQDILEVASVITKYNLFSVAVVDDEQKMLGIITVDDLMRHFLPRA
ncbi:MAG: CBS domain-containing protein, partial [Candidatus Magasanikbacteria bacterium]|nr:CBS domain-containing protein [Candidatus Magasanikbacteria bacterium]